MKKFLKQAFSSRLLISCLAVVIVAFGFSFVVKAQNPTENSCSQVFNISGDFTYHDMANTDEEFGGSHHFTQEVFVEGIKVGLNESEVFDSSGALTIPSGQGITIASGNLTITSGNATLTSGNLTLTSGNLDVTGTTVVDEFTQGGGSLVLATSTGTTVLTEAQLLAYNFLEITVNTGATATFQLPATSTMTTLLANTGDMREWFIHNATSSTMAMTITAGTGIDLIGVTTDDDIIDSTEYSRLSCIRQTGTNVTCIISELLHVD